VSCLINCHEHSFSFGYPYLLLKAIVAAFPMAKGFNISYDIACKFEKYLQVCMCEVRFCLFCFSRLHLCEMNQLKVSF
jgi:hypothetical protein